MPSSLRELISLLKANPGRYSYGSAGNGTTNHLAGEMLNAAAGVRVTHVPYKGSAPALQDVLGGQIS
jgi:tripartite-type tricarboxylate transporter receptor subunit TctC